MRISPTDHSSADLATGLVADAQRLLRLELELAKQETKELVVSNLIAAALLGSAAFALTIAIFIIIPVFLVEILPFPHWQTAAVWFGAYLVVAILLAILGKLLLKIEPPRRTLQSLKETREWLRHQMRSSVR